MNEAIELLRQISMHRVVDPEDSPVLRRIWDAGYLLGTWYLATPATPQFLVVDGITPAGVAALQGHRAQ